MLCYSLYLWTIVLSFYVTMFRYEECEVPDCSGHGHCQVAANNPQNISQDIFQNMSQNCQEAGLKMPILASLKIDITIIQNCLASKVLIMIVATPNIVLPKRCLVLKMTIATLRTGSVSA